VIFKNKRRTVNGSPFVFIYYCCKQTKRINLEPFEMRKIFLDKFAKACYNKNVSIDMFFHTI